MSESIYAVVSCTKGHGPQGLTQQEYDAAMQEGDKGWGCPVCGGEACWSDEAWEHLEDERFIEAAAQALEQRSRR
ncbi:MAG: hypothetical protein V3U34_00560 [candidate division NC10 bacterium]